MLRVLGEASFREAAQKVSVRMRAHRLKPAEKAAGASAAVHMDTCMLLTLPHPSAAVERDRCGETSAVQDGLLHLRSGILSGCAGAILGPLWSYAGLFKGFLGHRH